jgi:hypothetical protein
VQPAEAEAEAVRSENASDAALKQMCNQLVREVRALRTEIERQDSELRALHGQQDRQDRNWRRGIEDMHHQMGVLQYNMDRFEVGGRNTRYWSPAATDEGYHQ